MAGLSWQLWSTCCWMPSRPVRSSPTALGSRRSAWRSKEASSPRRRYSKEPMPNSGGRSGTFECRTFEWLPSHQSKAEATAAGLSQEDWLGKEQAVEAANAQARAVDIRPLLLSKLAENQAVVEAVWKLIAESQVSHLAGRPRREMGRRLRPASGRPLQGRAALPAGGCRSRSGTSRRSQQPMRGPQRQAAAGGVVQSSELDGRCCRRSPKCTA